MFRIIIISLFTFLLTGFLYYGFEPTQKQSIYIISVLAFINFISHIIKSRLDNKLLSLQIEKTLKQSGISIRGYGKTIKDNNIDKLVSFKIESFDLVYPEHIDINKK